MARKQRGVALLAALILMLAVVLTIGNIFYAHQIEVTRLTKSLHGDQALLLALSAENWARQLLSSEQDDREVDTLQENWAIAVPILPVEGGFLRGCIQDLQSLANINSFATYTSEQLQAEMENEENGLARLWLALLRNNELPYNEASVATIIDWVDGNDDQVSEWGAEQQNYDSNRTQAMVANALITDVEELAVMQGYGPGAVALIKPWVSALPRMTTININTAPEEILLAMGGDNADVFAGYVMNQRPFYSLDTFHEGLGTALDMEAQEVQALWPENLVGVHSDYFQLQLEVTLGESRLRIDSVLGRYDRNSPVVISRNIRVVPAIAERLSPIQGAESGLSAGFCTQQETS